MANLEAIKRIDLRRSGMLLGHKICVAYQGVVDYHAQPLVGVSDSHPSAAEPAFDQWHSGNRTLHMYSPM